MAPLSPNKFSHSQKHKKSEHAFLPKDKKRECVENK